MNTVAQILEAKAEQSVHTIGPAASALEAAQRMAESNVGALVVVDADRVIGIVSERDQVRRLLSQGRSPGETTVGEIMSAPVMYVGLERTADECRALMTRHRLRHLPVLQGDRLVGLVSIGDLVKVTISEQQFIIEQMELYISGQHG